MILCKVLLLLVYIQICASQNTTCSGYLTHYWTSNWNNLNEYKRMFFVLSRSTNVMVSNYRDLMNSGIDIVTPIIFRPFRSSEIYEIAVVTSSIKLKNLYFASIFKGKLTFYGNYREKSNQTDLKIYVFRTQEVYSMNCVTLFQTCQITMTAMEQISGQKVWILFVSVSDELEIKKIAANITAYIEAAEMQDYRFFEFEVEGIDSCEILKNQLMKCKAENKTSVRDTFIACSFLLLMITIFAAKSFRCVRQIRSNRVHDIHN